MPAEHGYYRHPTIHGNTVCFACEDDLWTVPAEGGLARRLTASLGAASFPRYSPDGRRIAFTGREEGPTEVYAMDAEGGLPQRLTWIGGLLQLAGWTPDGKNIVFGSNWRQPFVGSVALHTVPASGGAPEPLGLGPARAIAYQPGGPGVVIGRNTADPARWKRYRGGTAGRLWVDRSGSGDFVSLLTLEGNHASPMWIGDRIFFLSDHEGYGNIYSCTPTGRGIRRHTHEEGFYVRYPSTDGRRIVYHAGADLYIHDPETGEARKIDIRIASPRAQRNRRFVSGAKYFESFRLHPQGHSLATVNRGGLFTMGLWEGAPRRYGKPSTVRYRLGSWLPDGKRIVAVSDEGGEESLVVYSAAGNGAADTPAPAKSARGRRGAAPALTAPDANGALRIEGDFGRALDLQVAPAGPDRVALTNQRQEVIVVDLASGKSRVVERSPHARIEGLAWSPDGRWLAYGFFDTQRTCRIHLCDTENNRVTPVTRSDFRDLRPSFDPDGRYLYFVSLRVFDPVYDSMYFDLGFPKGMRPCLIPLRRDLPSPFSTAMRPARAPGAPVDGGKPNGDAAGQGKKREEKSQEQPVRVEIDFEGIEDRVVALPVPEGSYDWILGGKNRVFFMSLPVEGSLDSDFMSTGEPAGKHTLHMYNLEEDKLETVAERVSDFGLSADAKVLAIRSANRMRVVPAGWKAEGKPPNDQPGRESGWIDLERLRVAVNPGEEWKQMFREAWRLQRDQFWSPDMSGHDWVAVHDRYLPLVDRVATRSEFSDLLWEMQGELGTSHCYELGGDYRPEPAWFHGQLGADLALDRKTGTWKVTRIPRGDSWDERRASPLGAPGVNLREGDEILEVAGEPVGREVSPYEKLVNWAGREIELTVRSGAGRGARGRTSANRPGKAATGVPGTNDGEIRRVTVKTLREECSLRYRDWVEANRAWVHEQSEGRIGYVHIINMGPLGYAEFHRYFASEAERLGLIVDVRWNGGGHVSQLILEKLLRKRIGYDANRWGTPEPYPSDAPMGPMVALTNENAGSDGDIFSHCFKLVGLGPLIGKRTWGGVVGIWPRHALVDGSVTTQPEFAFWFQDVGWGVENYGTDPDIVVEIRPQDHKAGRDPQLERALAEVEKIVRKQKPKVPDLKNRPRIGPGKLPKLPK